MRGVRPLIAEAQTTGTYGDLSYITVDSDGDGTDDYVEITDCDESAIEVEIPAEIEGLPVKSIGDSAFYLCESLESITIPDGVTHIEPETFYGCVNLEQIEIPENVEYIGRNVFNGTQWLENKQAENPLVIINDILVDGTTCTGNVVVPDVINSITGSAFYMCTGITSITIPDGVTSIESYSFSGCSNLESVDIPDSVTVIGRSAFTNTALKNVVIPYNVTVIGGYSFARCPNLESITILNPECEIIEINGLDGSTISNRADQEHDIGDVNYFFDGTIYGYENSTAQAYAEKYDRNFVSLGEYVEPIQGDISGNGIIDLHDAIEICKSIMNMRTFTEEEKIIADYNGDGTVDLYDAIEIARTLLPK